MECIKDPQFALTGFSLDPLRLSGSIVAEARILLMNYLGNEKIHQRNLPFSIESAWNHKKSFCSTPGKTFSLLRLMRKVIRELQFGALERNIGRVDAYRSGVSVSPVIDWHTDRAGPENFLHREGDRKSLEGTFDLKVFIYLTDVQVGNGELSIIPGSHIVNGLIRRGFHMGLWDYIPDWNCNEIGELIASNEFRDFATDFSGMSHGWFIEREEMLSAALNGSQEFGIPMSSGGIVVFDERAWHCGAAPTKSDRLVCRIICKPSEIYLGAVNEFC